MGRCENRYVNEVEIIEEYGNSSSCSKKSHDCAEKKPHNDCGCEKTKVKKHHKKSRKKHHESKKREKSEKSKDRKNPKHRKKSHKKSKHEDKEDCGCDELKEKREDKEDCGCFDEKHHESKEKKERKHRKKHYKKEEECGCEKKKDEDVECDCDEEEKECDCDEEEKECDKKKKCEKIYKPCDNKCEDMCKRKRKIRGRIPPIVVVVKCDSSCEDSTCDDESTYDEDSTCGCSSSNIWDDEHRRRDDCGCFGHDDRSNDCACVVKCHREKWPCNPCHGDFKCCKIDKKCCDAVPVKCVIPKCC
jgi:hypothetical protein